LKRPFLAAFLLVVLFGCDFLGRPKGEDPIARVKDNYLYKEELKNIVPSDLKGQDSILFVNAYINRWARRLLLMEGAQRNLDDEKQLEFESLISQYRTDLYTKAYLDALVLQNIDTLVTNEEAQHFYDLNRESFKLNEDLIRLRYINMSQSALNTDEVIERIQRFDSIDRPFLDSISVQFNSFSLKDSIWVSAKEVVDKIPVIDSTNENELLKISNFLQLKDSINLYLIKVVDVRRENDYAPLPYVMPSIYQLVLNKRKLELTKQLENDIIKDAIKTNDFETYE
jgi:hypothetical protein